MATNIVLTFQRDPSPAVTGYTGFFTVTPAGASAPNAPLTINIARTPAGDATGYTINYTDITGAPALNPGDSIAGAVESLAGSVASPMIPAAGSPIVIPTPPPTLTGPVNVTETLVQS